MEKKIHYISDKWNSKFIIAKTECEKHWQDINEFTAIKELVTCKKCKNDNSKKRVV